MSKKVGVLFFLMVCLMFGAEKYKMSGAFGWYPLLMEKDGKVTGVSYEVSQELAKRMEIEIEVVTGIPWKRVLNSAKLGTLDIVGGAYYNAEREKEIESTYVMAPFMKNSVRLFVNKNNMFKFEKFEDLIDKTGAKPLGGKYGEEFEIFLKNNNIKLREAKSNDNLFKMIGAERVDYVLADVFDGMNDVKKQNLEGKIIPLEKEVKATDCLFIISNKSPLFKRIDEIDKILREMENDGTIKKIVSKYM